MALECESPIDELGGAGSLFLGLYLTGMVLGRLFL